MNLFGQWELERLLQLTKHQSHMSSSEIGLKKNVNEKLSNEIRIVYAGSVTETNCENIIKLP